MNGERFFSFVIFNNEHSTLIDAIELRSPNDSRGQLGSWLNEKYWGEGVAIKKR